MPPAPTNPRTLLDPLILTLVKTLEDKDLLVLDDLVDLHDTALPQETQTIPASLEISPPLEEEKSQAMLLPI